jgi:hypothetical protein
MLGGVDDGNAVAKGMLFAVLLLAGAAARCADLTLRVEAREVARQHVHTDMTLAVRAPGS